MKPQRSQLDAGLYLLATPIGNARDITLRALDVLASADVIAAEDTRTTRKLMDIHGVPLEGRKLIPYHDHSNAAARAGIEQLIAAGKSVAYASEAGSPLIADPGFALARDIAAAGHLVTTVPGASATLVALSLSGLPTDRFMFAGFPPATKGARVTWLQDLLPLPTTLVMFESPKRIHRLLGDLCQTGAGERKAAICRELTKRFEEVLRGRVSELEEHLQDANLRGEIVLVLDRPGATREEDVDLDQMLMDAMDKMTMKDAVAAVSEALNLPRRTVYQAALEVQKSK